MQGPDVDGLGVGGVSVNSSPPQNQVSHSEKEISGGGKVSAPSSSSSDIGLAGGISALTKWVNRIAVVLFVTLCAAFGMLLIILPWTPKWTDNYLLISYPALRDFLENGFVRGMCTGLGAIDVWIGFREAMQYDEKVTRV